MSAVVLGRSGERIPVAELEVFGAAVMARVDAIAAETDGDERADGTGEVSD